MYPLAAVLPAHLRDNEDEALKAELLSVQKYLDETELDLGAPTLYFVTLKGVYTHISRKMAVTGLFVNRTGKPVEQFAATVGLQTDRPDMEIATIKIALPPEFLGGLEPNQALLLTMSAPVRGLGKDEVFEASQFRSELSDVQVVLVKSEGD
jgi:hypothetical protein